MRGLNKKQKDMLVFYYRNNPNNYNVHPALLEAIENVNWYETAHNDIQNYYADLKIQAKVNKQYNNDYAKFKRGEL